MEHWRSDFRESEVMYDNAALKYEQAQARTASPSELLLALYEGLFRFLRGSKICLENQQLVKARELLSRSYAILSELYIALDHSQAPQLCEQLAALYSFCMDQVLEGSHHADANKIDDVIRVLTPLREAFVAAVAEVSTQQRTQSFAGPA